MSTPIPLICSLGKKTITNRNSVESLCRSQTLPLQNCEVWYYKHVRKTPREEENMKYLVTYQETLSRTLIVEADSFDEAEDKMMKAVECGDFELTMEDYLCDSGCIAYVDGACQDDEGWYRSLDEFTN